MKSKTIRILKRIKRQLKRESHRNPNNENLKIRRQLVTKYIKKEYRQGQKRKIVSTIESLRRQGGGIKEETFWEFKRKLHPRKEETPTAVQDEEGNLKESTKDILEEY